MIHIPFIRWQIPIAWIQCNWNVCFSFLFQTEWLEWWWWWCLDSIIIINNLNNIRWSKFHEFENFRKQNWMNVVIIHTHLFRLKHFFHHIDILPLILFFLFSQMVIIIGIWSIHSKTQTNKDIDGLLKCLAGAALSGSNKSVKRRPRRQWWWSSFHTLTIYMCQSRNRVLESFEFDFHLQLLLLLFCMFCMCLLTLVGVMRFVDSCAASFLSFF